MTTKLFRSFPHCWRMAWVVLCLLALVPACSLAANKQAVESSLPDLLVWVEARYPNGQSISITYPTVVPRSTAEQNLARLLQETGWTAANASISSESASSSGANPMTSVEFFVPRPIDVKTGYLPIESIIKAFRDLKTIQVLYFAPPTFNFTGPPSFENRFVKITLNKQDSTFTYDIRIKDPNFTTLGLPSTQQPSTRTRNSAGAGLGWGTISLIVLLALVVWVLVYAITDRLVKKGQRTNRRS